MLRCCSLLLTCFLVCVGYAADNSARPVHTEMRNIAYHFSDTVAAHIAYLEGELVPIPPAELPIFDDPQSFSLPCDQLKSHSLRTP